MNLQLSPIVHSISAMAVNHLERTVWIFPSQSSAVVSDSSFLGFISVRMTFKSSKFLDCCRGNLQSAIFHKGNYSPSNHLLALGPPHSLMQHDAGRKQNHLSCWESVGSLVPPKKCWSCRQTWTLPTIYKCTDVETWICHWPLKHLLHTQS